MLSWLQGKKSVIFKVKYIPHGNDLWSQANCIFDVCEKNVSIISDKKEIVYIPENSSACISISDVVLGPEFTFRPYKLDK